MRVYVTKYALTTGIIETEAEYTATTTGGMVTSKAMGSFSHFHGEGREWHRTLEGAVAKAKTMRDRKIASIKKKIAELEKRTFDSVVTIV